MSCRVEYFCFTSSQQFERFLVLQALCLVQTADCVSHNECYCSGLKWLLEFSWRNHFRTGLWPPLHLVTRPQGNNEKRCVSALVHRSITFQFGKFRCSFRPVSVCGQFFFFLKTCEINKCFFIANAIISIKHGRVWLLLIRTLCLEHFNGQIF